MLKIPFWLVLVLSAGCSSVEEFEGTSNNCSTTMSEPDVWMLVERPLGAEPRIFFGFTDASAQDTWIVARADHIEEDGPSLKFSATFDLGGDTSANTLDLDLERENDDYSGTFKGESSFDCDVDMALADR